MTLVPRNRYSTRYGWFLVSILLAVGVFGCQSNRHATISLEAFIEKSGAEGNQALSERAIDLTRLSEAEAPSGDYQLGPGDLLTVTIYRLEQADAPSVLTTHVADDGTIAVPLIGTVKASGLRPDQLEAAIGKKLSPKFIRHPRVTIVVASYRQFSVLVLGAVTNPGQVLLRRDQRNLVHAISAVGGLTEAASGLVILRPATGSIESYQIETEVDFARAMARKPLAEGDIIVAKQNHLPVIYVHGLVGNPGAIQIPRQGVSIMQAVVAAGGLPIDFNADKAFLTRRFKDGSEHSVKLDLKQLAQGEIPNLTMRAGDILEVPHTRKTRTAEFIKENIVFRAGIDATLNPWPYILTPRYQFDNLNDGGGVGRIIRDDLVMRGARKLTEPLGF